MEKQTKQKGYPEVFPVLFYLLGSINGVVPWWANWFICMPIFVGLWFCFFYELKLVREQKA
jgi:hypothetical protein